MLSFKNFLTEIIKNKIGKDEKLPHSTIFDPKDEHAGYKRESVKTNTGHHIYTYTDSEDVHHIWVHPKTGHIDLSVEASIRPHPDGRITYYSMDTRGRKRIQGSQNNSPPNNSPPNMAPHGYNDLHGLGVITQHESQSPGAQEIQTRLVELYPKTNLVYYNEKTGKSYPTSHVRPFIDPLGNSNQPPPLARFALYTSLSASTEKVNKKRLEANKKLYHSLRK